MAVIIKEIKLRGRKKGCHILDFVDVHRFRVHRSGFKGSGPTAMPQYPQIVLFSRGIPSELTNQQFRFEVNPEPMNPEPVNGY